MLKDPKEKESAFRGFCAVLPISIKAVTNNFPFLCSCFIKYKQPPADLEQQFGRILSEFKQYLIAQSATGAVPSWELYIKTFPETLRQDLAQRF